MKITVTRIVLGVIVLGLLGLAILGLLFLNVKKISVWQTNHLKSTTRAPLPLPKKNQKVFRLAEDLTVDYPATVGDLEFARLVAAKSGGKLKIIVYYGAQLGDEKSVIEQVQFGGIDFARVNAAPLSEFYKPLSVLSLPYLFRDTAHLKKVLYGPIGQELLTGLATKNLFGLTYYSSAARSFYARRPIRTLSDMRGMKIRVQQSKLYMDLVTALGGEPVPTTLADVYNALLMGKIDGAENNWSSYYDVKHYEVAKYYTVDMHTRTPEVLMVNRDIFLGLPKEDQEIIIAAARESVNRQWESSTAQELSSEGAVIKQGTNVIELNASQKAAFKKAVEPLYATYEKDYYSLIQRIKNTQ